MFKLSTKCQIESWLLYWRHWSLMEPKQNKSSTTSWTLAITCHFRPLPTESRHVKAPLPCRGPFAAIVAVILKALWWVRCCPSPAIVAGPCGPTPCHWPCPSWASTHYLTPSLRASVGYQYYWSLWILMIPSCSINILSSDWYRLWLISSPFTCRSYTWHANTWVISCSRNAWLIDPKFSTSKSTRWIKSSAVVLAVKRWSGSCCWTKTQQKPTKPTKHIKTFQEIPRNSKYVRITAKYESLVQVE